MLLRGRSELLSAQKLSMADLLLQLTDVGIVRLVLGITRSNRARGRHSGGGGFSAFGLRLLPPSQLGLGRDGGVLNVGSRHGDVAS